jgi:hypothetical protein
MKISVVIPVYREEGIAALLDDLLRRSDAGEASTVQWKSSSLTARPKATP